MLWYIGVATFLFLGYFYRKDKLWYIFSLFVLFCFSAFRNLNLGGSDAKFYSDYYHSVPPLTQFNGFQGEYEIGYTLFNSFLKIFSDNYAFFQIVYTAVTLFLLHLVISKLDFNHNEKCLFLFVYFCYRYIWNTWVILRQNFSNLIIWMLIFIVFTSKGRKWLIYFIAIVISTLFHSTSIINLILFPLMLIIKKINPKTMLIIATILSIVLYFFGIEYKEEIMNIMLKLAGERFERYSDTTQEINIINLLLRLGLMWFIGLNIHRLNYRWKREVFASIALTVILGSINISLVIRVYEYYAIGFYAGIIIFVRSFRKYDKFFCVIGIYVIMVIILTRYLITAFHNGVYNLFF